MITSNRNKKRHLQLTPYPEHQISLDVQQNMLQTVNKINDRAINIQAENITFLNSQMRFRCIHKHETSSCDTNDNVKMPINA